MSTRMLCIKFSELMQSSGLYESTIYGRIRRGDLERQEALPFHNVPNGRVAREPRGRSKINAESYLKIQEYSFLDSHLNNVFARQTRYATKRVTIR